MRAGESHERRAVRKKENGVLEVVRDLSICIERNITGLSVCPPVSQGGVIASLQQQQQQHNGSSQEAETLVECPQTPSSSTNKILMKRLTESNIAAKDLLANTNELLAHVGINAKPIVTVKELTRVASSMFVAIFEALFRTRVVGVIRHPKGPQDYIANCQVVLDCLANQLQMDLRHITGESIFNGDRRALSNLVNILLRIATITGKSNGQDEANQFVGRGRSSESISSHESAFAHLNHGTRDRPDVGKRTEDFSKDVDGDVIISDISQPWEAKHEQDIEPPPSFLEATAQDSPSVPHLVQGNEALDLAMLKSSISEFEQHKKVEAARRRREQHLKNKVTHASVLNARSVQKTYKAMQRHWEEDNVRDEYAALLQRQHDEHMMLRKVQRGILKHMREGQLEQTSEAREKIRDIRKEAKWHFQSLQNLFDDRVKMLRRQEMDLRESQEEDVGKYRHLQDEIRRFDQMKRKKVLNDNMKMVHQKRLFTTQMRRETHQQLLSYLSVGEAWEDSLRSSWPPSQLYPSTLLYGYATQSRSSSRKNVNAANSRPRTAPSSTNKRQKYSRQKYSRKHKY